MTTTAVCIKVNSLRKMGYADLEQWMNDDCNEYVGRNGRIFITDPKTKEKKIFHYPRSKWANPFTLKEYSLERSLEKYREHLLDKGLIKNIGELKGKNLGCFCDKQRDSDGEALCHAEILTQLANNSWLKDPTKRGSNNRDSSDSESSDSE